MKVYQLARNNQITEIDEQPFKLEREIQSLFEENLSTIMGLQCVRSELSINNRRIDTLAFDPQSNAFIIIEYKREKNLSVMDQGFTYLSLMLENKADFVLEHQEQMKSSMKIHDVDWSQSRVVFVSPSFTDNQIGATNFKDIAIELWEVKRYKNQTFTVNAIKKSATAASIKPALDQKDVRLRAIATEIKVYTEDDHRGQATEGIFELYEAFRDAVLALANDIEVSPQKFYIALKRRGNVVCIQLQKSGPN